MRLMTAGNSEGERRCDAKCYNAEHPDCDCCCGGINHGVGLTKAMENTTLHAQELLKRFGKEINISEQQLQLI